MAMRASSGIPGISSKLLCHLFSCRSAPVVIQLVLDLPPNVSAALCLAEVITSPLHADKMSRETNVPGLAVRRGAVGTPGFSAGGVGGLPAVAGIVTEAGGTPS